MAEHKTYIHNPPHLFVKNAKYFITSSTLGKYLYYKTDSSKRAILNYLTKSLRHHFWELEDWVILDNHIHFIANAPEKAATLTDVMCNFHRFSANWLAKNGIRKKAEKYFHNYWDTCLTYERSYFARLNYIWYNPVKHGYVNSPEEWKFGSYYYRLREEAESMQKQMEKYPFDNLKIKDDF